MLKIDDWIILPCGGYPKIDKIAEICYKTGWLSTVNGLQNFLIEDCNLWKPKEGEWVICRNGCDSAYIIRYKKHNYDFECEPFIGELPSFLK